MKTKFLIQILPILCIIALLLALTGGTALASTPPNIQNLITYYNINDGTHFKRSTTPFTSGVATQVANLDGSVTLNITSAPGYADTGFSIYEGKLGDLNGITLNGTGDGFGLNLWFDKDNDGEFFTWSAGTMSSTTGDTYGLGPSSVSGVLTVDNSSTFFMMNGCGSPTLAQLKAGNCAGIDSNTHIAIWVGINVNSGSKSTTITSLTFVPTTGLVFNPAMRLVGVGGTTTVNIEIDNVSSLYGYQFKVNYDATKVSASGAFLNSFFDTTSNAFIPPTWNAVCGSGVCQFAVSKQAPGLPVSGSGAVAQITFTGAGVGTVNLTFASDILSDKDGGVLAHYASAGTIVVYGSAAVSGIVALQGRATPIDSGTMTLTDQGGNFAPTTGNFDHGTGAFSFTGVPVMPDGSNYQFDAAHSLYLGNRLTHTLNNGDSYTAPTTKLKGGDADNSGLIDVSDLSCIGGAFGGGPASCGATGSSDINHDGSTNILDLVLAGGNYNLSTPQNW